MGRHPVSAISSRCTPARLRPVLEGNSRLRRGICSRQGVTGAQLGDGRTQVLFDGLKLARLVEPRGAPPLGEGGAVGAVSASVGALVVPHLGGRDNEEDEGVWCTHFMHSRSLEG